MTRFQMHVDEVLPGRRAPMSEQHVFDVRQHQRPLQQRIVVEIDLPPPTDSWQRANRHPSFRADPGVSVLVATTYVFRLESRWRTRVTDLAIMSSLVGADDAKP